MAGETDALSIVIVGASGDLGRKKIVPALFALFCRNLLPDNFRLFGFARSAYSDDAFRDRIAEHLTCRYAPGASCGERMAAFLARCHYCRGAYDSVDAYLDLYRRMRELEQPGDAKRLYYLAIPPKVFESVVRTFGNAGMVNCSGVGPWSRVVIEKPFGRDRGSSDELTRQVAQVFTEDQTYRIDHYLGKEVVQNLMVLRFANTVFEPIWNRHYIERMTIDWAEDNGVEARAGYFDDYGIIRDVVQNHMLQILALAAMDRPAAASPHGIRDQKVRVLRAIPPLALSDLVVGQYAAGTAGGKAHGAYREEDGVAPDSLTATYARACLQVGNDRWRGVPFVIRAGKGLDRHCNEVRVRFRAVADNPFGRLATGLRPNELVMRIQPDPALYLQIANKRPGLDMALAESKLDLIYKSAFDTEIPEAYECLLLDVIRGDKSLFIRGDELEAAWDIFTPVLHELESLAVEPRFYPFGSSGPQEGTSRNIQRRQEHDGE